MTIAAVIAEYNPFHAGHAYHIAETRRLTGADGVLVLMSGDFVQRGEPAVFDKFTRTRMALAAGADVVVELPLPAACGSAEYFAEGGVRLADALGADFLSFGSETDDLTRMEAVAAILADEPKAYKEALQRELKNGATFAAAREAGVMAALACSSDADLFENPGAVTGQEAAVFHAILSSPNAALGLEYLKAIRRQKAALRPVIVKRAGAGYHETGLPAGTERADGLFPSATALRKALHEGTPYPELPGAFLHAEISPDRTSCPLFADDMTAALHHALLTPAADVWDMPESLARRLTDRREPFGSWTELCQKYKTKDLTYTRLSRALLHRVLGVTCADAEGFCAPEALYGRILGLRKGSPLPALLKEKSRIPLITKLSDGEAALAGRTAGYYLKKDMMAHEWYRTLVWEKHGVTLPEEHQAGIVMHQ